MCPTPFNAVASREARHGCGLLERVDRPHIILLLHKRLAEKKPCQPRVVALPFSLKEARSAAQYWDSRFRLASIEQCLPKQGRIPCLCATVACCLGPREQVTIGSDGVRPILGLVRGFGQLVQHTGFRVRVSEAARQLQAFSKIFRSHGRLAY
jgi:hypothetical protein